MAQMSDGATATVLELSGVRFSWSADAAPLLDIDRLRIAQGERIALRGPSGSGKSTLLSLAGGSRYAARRLGTASWAATSARYAARSAIGFEPTTSAIIFQMFNLIPYLSVIENVVSALRILAQRRSARCVGGRASKRKRCVCCSTSIWAEPTLLRRPVTELSVGQQQRVAAARALIGAPELVIADEPTSALDADRREAFLDLLFRAVRTGTHRARIFVSHDASLAPLFDRTIEFCPDQRDWVRQRPLGAHDDRWRLPSRVCAIAGSRGADSLVDRACGRVAVWRVERIREQSRESFASTISGTDLIVGARSSPVHLLLFSVFRIGNATNNVRWDTYRALRQPSRGRLDDTAFTRRFAPGISRAWHDVGVLRASSLRRRPQARAGAGRCRSRKPHDAVLGAERRGRTRLRPRVSRSSSPMARATMSVSLHEDHPFRVVGILARTGTPVDRTVHVPLEGIDAVHAEQTGARRRSACCGDWRATANSSASAGRARRAGEEPRARDHRIPGRLKSRSAALSMQRSVNEYPA